MMRKIEDTKSRKVPVEGINTRPIAYEKAANKIIGVLLDCDVPMYAVRPVLMIVESKIREMNLGESLDS